MFLERLHFTFGRPLKIDNYSPTSLIAHIQSPGLRFQCWSECSVGACEEVVEPDQSVTMDGTGVCLLFVFFSILGVAVSEVCTEIYGYSHQPKARTFHCSFGCCGPDYDQYCCVSHAGVIVGIVFACIFGIAFLSACICCFLKHHGARGRIVRPAAGGTTQTVVDSTGQSTTHTSVFIVASGTGPPSYQTAVVNPYFNHENQTGVTPSTFQPKPPAYEEVPAAPPAYTSPPPPPGYDDIGGGKWAAGGTNS